MGSSDEFNFRVLRRGCHWEWRKRERRETGMEGKKEGRSERADEGRDGKEEEREDAVEKEGRKEGSPCRKLQ